MKSGRKATTPEREGSVLQAKEKTKGWLSTKRTHMVYGQLCNAYGSIRNFNAKEDILAR